MLLIGGASAQDRDGMADFQEEHQVELCRPYCKYSRAGRVTRPGIPYLVEQAVRTAWYGRPGAAYLDMPDDVILGRVEDRRRPRRAPPWPIRPARWPTPPRCRPPSSTLQGGQEPARHRGQGHGLVRGPRARCARFIEHTQLPFLATPMGKGVVPDDHPLSVGGARSLRPAAGRRHPAARRPAQLDPPLRPAAALQARTSRSLQVDIAAEQICHNVPAARRHGR